MRSLLLCVVCREEVEKVKFRLKRESIKSYRYQAFSDRFVEHIQRTQGRKDGKVGLTGKLEYIVATNQPHPDSDV